MARNTRTDKFVKPVHPGEVIKHEVLDPLGMSVNKLAIELRVPVTRISEIVHGRRGITADTALRLARFLGTSSRFWLNLQSDYEIRMAERSFGDHIAQQVHPRNTKILVA